MSIFRLIPITIYLMASIAATAQTDTLREMHGVIQFAPSSLQLSAKAKHQLDTLAYNFKRSEAKTIQVSFSVEDPKNKEFFGLDRMINVIKYMATAHNIPETTFTQVTCCFCPPDIVIYGFEDMSTLPPFPNIKH